MPDQRTKNVRIWPVLRAYLHASSRYPWLLLFAVIGVLGIQAASLLVPLYLKKIIDALSLNAPSPEVIHGLFLFLAAYAALGALNWVSRRVQMISVMRIESNVMADLENDAFSYLMGHSLDFFSSNFAGTLTRRVTRYSRAYEQVFDSVLLNFLPTFVFATGSIFVLYLRNAWLGLGLLAWAIVFIGIQIALTRWRHPLRIARAAEDSRMTGALSDVVGNHSAVALFAAENHERDSFGAIVESWRKTTWRSWLADNFIQSAQHALAVIIEVGLLAAAILLWQRGLVTVGDFVLIQIYVLGLIDQVWNIGNTLRRLYDAFADASEMLDILELPHAIQDAPSATTLRCSVGEVRFENVRFGFENDRPILSDYGVHIRGGEKIALVGPSGAGKSTVTKLLLRLYDPQEGTITIDGQNIRSVTQHSLRSSIAFVPQEPVLFHRTLRENIVYGRRDASFDEIVEAAKQAHCYEFISRYPDGFDTHVGERGVKLSGGERQRVAIARAILKNAPILVLDEATSSLDSESEMLIQDALAKLMKGKTVIAIAHRLSTIMHMDRIVVMDGGRITLSGTHDELLAHESNLYKKLWEIQAGGFIRDDKVV